MRRYQSILLGAFLVCWTSCGFAEGGSINEAITQEAIFPTRVLGSIAAIGDSITQAFDAAYSDFGDCRYMDTPEYNFSTNTTANTTNSIAERAIAYRGRWVATANFGSDGARMSAGVDQAQTAKAWALNQAAPRLITVFLGHNDICAGNKDKFQISCSRADRDPNNYCRTSTFHYEQQMREMLDVLVTIPNSQIAIIHPIRVSQLCNFAREKVIDEWWLTARCEDLWATPNLFGQDGVCPSMTSCSADRIADAYTTWAAYRDIGDRLVEEYNLYTSGQTIPYNSTYNTGNVVRASSVFLQTTNVLGNSKFNFRDPLGNAQLSVCECYHPSKYGQNLLAKLVWKGVTCSTTTPCCDDSVPGDSDYNKGMCNNYTTSGSMSGLWYTGEDKTLTVVKAGPGTGVVTSTPGGIDCGDDCAEFYPPGTVVTLTASADTYSTFTGWSGGGCSGTGNCVVTMNADTTVKATFTSNPPILTSPNGGEVLPAGSSTFITWIAPPTMTKFKLFYSLHNGTTWTRIGASTNGTSIEWPVPLLKNNKTKCFVKVVAYDDSKKKLGSDKSDGPFTIEALTITNPVNNSTCASGQPCLIAWNRSTYIDAQTGKLFYSTDGGLTWKLITKTITGNEISYSWTPRVRATKKNCKIKLVYKNDKGVTVGTATSGKFTINKTQ